jgi:hypothetical protein
MIKTFESFNIGPEDKTYIDEYSDEDIRNILSDINLIYNNSIVRSGENREFGIIIDRFLKDTQVHDWLHRDDNIDYSIVPNFNLEKLEKIKIIQTYIRLYEIYHLEKLPDISDIDDILIPIRDLTEVTIVLELSKFFNSILTFSIDTSPSMIGKLSTDEFELNLDEYDAIVSEVKPAVDRIKSLGYKVTTKLSKFGEIKLIISK